MPTIELPTTNSRPDEDAEGDHDGPGACGPGRRRKSRMTRE